MLLARGNVHSYISQNGYTWHQGTTTDQTFSVCQKLEINYKYDSTVDFKKAYDPGEKYCINILTEFGKLMKY